MSNQASCSNTAYVVARPRASDAVGYALRDAYVREPLPDEMMVLLRQLNENDNGEMRART